MNDLSFTTELVIGMYYILSIRLCAAECQACFKFLWKKLQLFVLNDAIYVVNISDSKNENC